MALRESANRAVIIRVSRSYRTERQPSPELPSLPRKSSQEWPELSPLAGQGTSHRRVPILEQLVCQVLALLSRGLAGHQEELCSRDRGPEYTHATIKGRTYNVPG